MTSIGQRSLVFNLDSRNVYDPSAAQPGHVFYTWHISLQPIEDQPEYEVDLKLMSASLSESLSCLRPYIEYGFVEWQLDQKRRRQPPKTTPFVWEMVTRIELRLLVSNQPSNRIAAFFASQRSKLVTLLARFDPRPLLKYSCAIILNDGREDAEFGALFELVTSFRLDMNVFRFLFQSGSPLGALITPNTEAEIDNFRTWVERESKVAIKRAIANGSPFYVEESSTSRDVDDDSGLSTATLFAGLAVVILVGGALVFALRYKRNPA